MGECSSPLFHKVKVRNEMIIQYEHHGNTVAVREDLKGKHREHCLCYSCGLFIPEDRSANCKTANALYALCCLTGCTTPVWECPEFEENEVLT